MKCCYGTPECLHNVEGDCAIVTCYDEYDIGEGKPFPNKDIEDYWTPLLGGIECTHHIS